MTAWARARAAIFAAVAALFVSPPAAAQPAPVGAAAGASGDSEEGEGPPAGHALPPSHPKVEGHGGGGEGAVPGMFQPTPDAQEEVDDLPAGTITVDIVDADNRPLPHVAATLGIIHNSVAKGESRQHLQRDSDDGGHLRFDHLETGSGVAYRVTVKDGGATFASAPFPLSPQKGMRVLLHVYPVTSDIDKALVVSESILYAEVKDDRIQFQQAFRLYNFGRVAWVPKDVIAPLPPGFTALQGQQGMTDVGVDAAEGKGARLRGTIGPGRSDVEFQWQVPYDGDRDVDLDVGVAPHTAAARVMAAASQEMRLTVEGFPAAEGTQDGQGQRVLVTARQLTRADSPLTRVHVGLRDIPTEGPARKIATALAALGVLIGIVVYSRGASVKSGAASKGLRALLLLDLEDLERARLVGDVGPKTYERARRELIDALARTFDAPKA